MSRVAPYARGAWSRGPRRAAGGSAAADLIKVRRRVIWHGRGHARPRPSELVRFRLQRLAHGLGQAQPLALERYRDARASRADILEAVTILEDVARARQRVFGAHHPDTASALTDLERARMRREDVAAP